METRAAPTPRQKRLILLAAARVRLVQEQLCAEWARSGDSEAAQVRSFPEGHRALVDWTARHHEAVEHESIAVVPLDGASPRTVLAELDVDRRLLLGGVHPVSIFDVGLDLRSPLPALIAGAKDVPCFFGWVPLELRILDRETVVIAGPRAAGQDSLLIASDRELVRRALEYVSAVRGFATPARAHPLAHPDLTDRQHLVAGLLALSWGDEEIAAELGVSVRTVRYEVAKLMGALGVTTRFAAGSRYAVVCEPLRARQPAATIPTTESDGPQAKKLATRVNPMAHDRVLQGRGEVP